MSIQGTINKALGTAGAYSAIKGRLEDVKEEKSKSEKQTLAKKPKQTVDVLAKNPISSSELIAKMEKANERAKERKEAKNTQSKNFKSKLITNPEQVREEFSKLKQGKGE